MHAGLRRWVVVAAASVAAFATVVSTATADQFFHTSHAALTPIGSAPLRSGFVNDIHTQGATIAAQERYQLNGAMPNTTYDVALHVSFVDPTCTVTGILPTATFTTNASGNGEAGFTFYQTGPWPPPTPPTVVTIYIRWVVSSGGVPQYQTDCIAVALDL